MFDRRNGESTASDGGPTATRRQMLAAGAVLAAGGLSGCLGQIAQATTNVGASPAAHYSGDPALAALCCKPEPVEAAVRAYETGASDVRHVPATVRGGSGLLSGSVDLEGWSTSATTRAQNHNSSRSNRTSGIGWSGGDLDSDGDGVPDEAEALYAYLGGEPVIGERFTVSLPDARLPGDRGALADELTPRRLVDYLIGERDGERCESTESSHAVGIHRDVACRNLLSAKLEEQKMKTRRVAAFTTDSGTVVTGVSPEADGAAPMVFVFEDGTSSVPENLERWGEERVVGDAAVTSTLVCPVVATPADCPCPMPALFYLRRIRHDDQYLYTGGWLIDDGALYENAVTLLVGEGPTEVVAVDTGDLDGDGYGDLVAGRLSRRRSRYGSMTFSGGHDPDADYLPEALRTASGKKGYDYWLSASRDADDGGIGDDSDGDDDGEAKANNHNTTRSNRTKLDADERSDPTSVVLALDAPVIHLVDAAGLSNDVKFKAGAELSKSVN